MSWAYFQEKGTANVAMQVGTNRRIFDTWTASSPSQKDILYHPEAKNGLISIAPGTYYIDAWSLTTFGWQLTPQQYAAMYSAPGYAFRWNNNLKEDNLVMFGWPDG